MRESRKGVTWRRVVNFRRFHATVESVLSTLTCCSDVGVHWRVASSAVACPVSLAPPALILARDLSSGVFLFFGCLAAQYVVC